MSESPPLISPPRRTRRVSHNLTIRVQAMVTADMAASIRQLADLAEISDGEVLRSALAAYVPDALKSQRKRVYNARQRKGRAE